MVPLLFFQHATPLLHRLPGFYSLDESESESTMRPRFLVSACARAVGGLARFSAALWPSVTSACVARRRFLASVVTSALRRLARFWASLWSALRSARSSLI